MPRQLDTAGGETVRLFGANIGKFSRDIASVLIGGRECTNVAVRSTTELSCTAPPGTGKTTAVVLTQASGLSFNSDSLLGFKPPVVTSVSPSYVLTGSVHYNITVSGRYLGSSMDPPQRVVIGGNPCEDFILLSSTQVRCIGVPGASGWPS